MKISDNFSWIWSILGSLGTAVAIISLIQKIGDIELASLPAQYLGYYRSFVSTLIGWIPLPFEWKIAQWYADLMTIGAVLLLTLGRTEKIAPLNPEPSLVNYPQKIDKRTKIFHNILGFLYFFFIVFLAPIAIILSILMIVRAYFFWRIKSRESNFRFSSQSGGLEVQSLNIASRYWFKTLTLLFTIVFSATTLFFLLNGLQVSS
ncbi:MAG TPA: hypothetical protein PKJ85_01890 [Nitrosomonas nitrosa]|nr:hypothetical protein [Nitrosomonas nitrosa]